MSESMQKEIDALVAELSPVPCSLGMLTTHEMVPFLRMAATKGAMIGWCAAETRYKQEYENLKAESKQLELEIMELKR